MMAEKSLTELFRHAQHARRLEQTQLPSASGGGSGGAFGCQRRARAPLRFDEPRSHGVALGASSQTASFTDSEQHHVKTFARGVSKRK